MPEVIFTGPAGRIEGRYHPARQKNAPIGIVLHPHPQFGGTMNYQIVYQLYYAFVHRNFSVLRFNFRGVGRSQGAFDHGQGELSDAAAALDWAQTINQEARSCWIAGFSFGAWIGMQLLMRRPEIEGFISVAPPANLYDFSFLAPCPSSGLIVHGDRDAVVPHKDVTTLVDKLKTQKGIIIEQKVIPGANHFFDAKIEPLMQSVTSYLDKRLKIERKTTAAVMRGWLLALAALLVIACVVAAGALYYMTTAPGRSHAGPLPQLTDEERALAATLRRHVEAIAAAEHNTARPEELEKVAAYLERTLASYGFTVSAQRFTTDGVPVRNVEVVIEPRSGVTAPDVLVVGAHYDTAENTPGANDNASGTAAVLELARLLRDQHGRTDKRLRLVLFVNEEPPHYRTQDMGSLRYARMLAETKERVTAMYSIETIGYFSDSPGSQSFPPPFGVLFPDRADFVSFVGLTHSRALVRETLRSFRAHTAFPSIGGVAPDIIPGIGWSDHWSFAQFGFQALMVTDTAVYRYPHYHEPTDTPDKVDTEKVARIVKGMERVIRDAMR